MEDDILGLNVSVDDPLSMDVVQPVANLPDDVHSLTVVESLLLLEFREQVPVDAQLLEDIETLAI